MGGTSGIVGWCTSNQIYIMSAIGVDREQQTQYEWRAVWLSWSQQLLLKTLRQPRVLHGWVLVQQPRAQLILVWMRGPGRQQRIFRKLETDDDLNLVAHRVLDPSHALRESPFLCLFLDEKDPQCPSGNPHSSPR